MDRGKGKKGNTNFKALPRPGDYYNNLSQSSKEAYTAGTIGQPVGKRRVLPEHILKLIATPKHRDEVLPTLGLTNGHIGEAITPVSKDMPRYYSRLELVPTATCYLCGTTYKLTAIKYHRPTSLSPEQPICSWCYRDLKCDGALTPKATPGNRVDRGYTGTKAKSIEDKLILAATVLLANTSTTAEQVDRYIISLKEDNRVELYFDREHKLMADQRLVEDFIDQLEDASDDEQLEEFVYTIE